MTLKYSAIETRTPIKHHLATMQLKSKGNDICELEWTTEIDPEVFSDAIYQGMLISVEGLKKFLLIKTKDYQLYLLLMIDIDSSLRYFRFVNTLNLSTVLIYMVVSLNTSFIEASF